MKIKRINGILFYNLFLSGLNNLKKHEEEVNKMNVFPVPDGDTGYNMCLTLENGLKSTKKEEHAGRFLGELAVGMLYGARGNSGVILSQIVNGLANELKKDSIVDAHELYEGFTTAYQYAYKSVVKPEEGTILTVIREGVQPLKDAVSRGTYVDVFFNIYLANLKISLTKTPDLLPILKEAGVVDSGALGFIYIIEGMLSYLNNGVIDFSETKQEIVPSATIKEENKEYGYCTEVIIKRHPWVQYSKEIFIEELNGHGNSIVVAEIDLNVKIHIHTFIPGNVLNLCQRYGTIKAVKVEDMDTQADELKKELDKDKEPIKKDIIKIAVVDGLGNKNIYKEIGCDVIVDGGSKVMVATNDLVDAVKDNVAKMYFIIPNNKNSIPAANLAVEMLKNKNVFITPTTNILEGYFALSCDDETSNDLEYRKHLLLDNYESINTIVIFSSTRDAVLNNVSIKKGDYTSLNKNEVLSSNNSIKDTIINSLEKIDDIDSYSTCVILKGLNFGISEEEIASIIEEKYPQLSLSFLDGGQSIYNAIIGLL